MSNAIENGSFAMAKQRFYHSGIDSEDQLEQIIDLFKTNPIQQQKLALNYLKFLRKMVGLGSNTTVDD